MISHDERVTDIDLSGTYVASFDFRAERRIRLKSDHSFEMYSVYWNNLRTTPASEVRESSGRDVGRWTRKGGAVVLVSATGTSSSFQIEPDGEAVCLVAGKLRYRMISATQRAKAEPSENKGDGR
jgi:hypothetical protein